MKIFCTSTLWSAFTLVSFLLSGSSAHAQDNAGDGATVVYPAAYFAEYSPVSAQDMLDRIPGVSSGGGGGQGGGGSGGGFSGRSTGGQGAGGRRGLGDGGGGDQVLINGKRTAGKSNNAGSQLGRIAASLVNYIEIIRSTSGDLDVRGSGQVVNVVLFEELDSASLSYDATATRYWDHEVHPGGSLSYGGKWEELEYLFSAALRPGHEYRQSWENSVLGDFSPNDQIRERRNRDQDTYELTTNLGYAFTERSSARFNALYSLGDSRTAVDRWTVDLKVTPRPVYREFEDLDTDQDNWELGGDYELNFANDSRLKILFIANENTEGTVHERFAVKDTGERTKNRFLSTASQDQERILRGSYTFDFNDNQNLEAGVERARTTLNSTLKLAVSSASGTPDANSGGLVPVTVANANSLVEEIRVEPFLVHNWQLSPRTTLESTLKYEESEISQRGDVNNKRKLTFLKPKLDYRFNVTPVLQLRGTIERTVSQLSFRDFVAVSDLNDNDGNVEAGNVQLVPEEAWAYEIHVEYRLPNDSGVIDTRFFYHDLDNVIERIDVSPSPMQLLSANGNIGAGKRYGFITNASVRLGFIGLPNVLTTSSLTVQDSAVTDPFLGIKRRTSLYNRGFLRTGFRHDLPRYNFNYGLTFNNPFDNNRKRYDLEDIELTAGDPGWNVFAEWTGFNDLTFRFEANSFVPMFFCRERQRFVGRISDGILEEIEDSCNTPGKRLSLGVSGTF